MKLKTTLFLLAFLCHIYTFSQITVSGTLNWNTEATELTIAGENIQIWKFDGGITSDLFDGLPFYLKQIDLPSDGNFEVEIIDAQFEPFPMTPSVADQHLSERLVFKNTTGRDRNRYYGKMACIPIVKRFQFIQITE